MDLEFELLAILNTNLKPGEMVRTRSVLFRNNLQSALAIAREARREQLTSLMF